MFYFRYLSAELIRRFGKTLTISLGLAIASAIIIAIISVSQSLSASQDKVLNPLQNVGTDIMVTRSVSTENLSTLDTTTRQEAMSENRIQTDLSKLGNPGDSFVSDTFATGTQLSFDSTVTANIDSSLVKNYATGLMLTVQHQEGKIPSVTATFKTGGETYNVQQDIAPMTDAEQQAVDNATRAAESSADCAADQHSDACRQATRAARDAAMPDRFKGKMNFQFTAPEKSYTQDVGPISTDIKTTSYTVAGVDTSKTDIGLILPNQVVDGKYFDGGANEIIVSKSYADKNGTKVGDKFTINKQELTITGIVDPKLYTNTADFYMPLSDLQKLAGKDGRINILLVKSANAKNVDATSKSLSSLFTGASITSAQDTAKQVSGSLVSAANLTNKFIGIVSVIIVLAAFVIVSLLTILSVNKRIREIGTLKAIGWSNGLIIRQIIMENIVLGLFGAVIGIGLGIGAIAILNHFNISLQATIASASSSLGGGFMRRFGGNSASTQSSGTTTAVQLHVAFSYAILGIGAGVAFLGSIFAGTLAAVKASGMKPQEALRNLE
ncbi:MAG: FtsX-like permease family protein [Candidatus Berkelbacteria bacterium]|nr:FtsX-like permease family protein [Candidatus Berkelbacteria bacterium]